MGCTTIEDALIPFHFGTCDAETRAFVEAHLVSCPACLQSYLGVKRSVELGAATFTPRPSPRARARLRAEIAATFVQVVVPRPSVAGRRLGWASLGAAAAVLALALWSPRLSPFSGSHEAATSFAPMNASVTEPPAHPTRDRKFREQVDSARLALAEPQYL